MKLTTNKLADLQFATLPRDACQMVERSYAADDAGLWRRTIDRSTLEMSFEFAKYDDSADEADLRFEPQNGTLPKHGEWRQVPGTVGGHS